MNRSKQRSISSYLVLATIFVIALFIVACGGGEEPESPEIALEEITLPSPTPRPTETPVPTNTPTPEPTSTPDATTNDEASTDGSNDGGSETLPDEFVEPEFVSINFRQGTINDWVEIQPPPGWFVSSGLDGMVISQTPDQVPEVPFALVRRWGNVVSVGDWIAYLPSGIEERNSNVNVRMGGYNWEGVFITTEDNSYRAFFAVSNETLPAYTVLVYIPMNESDLGEEEESFTREALLEKWDLNASELNTILRRFLFS